MASTARQNPVPVNPRPASSAASAAVSAASTSAGVSDMELASVVPAELGCVRSAEIVSGPSKPLEERDRSRRRAARNDELSHETGQLFSRENDIADGPADDVRERERDPRGRAEQRALRADGIADRSKQFDERQDIRTRG